MNKLALGVALLSMVFLSACGSGSTGTQTPPPAPVQATVTVTSATSGPFDLAMSTSFQPAEWDYTFFQQFPSATTPLGALNPSHIRLQGISQGIPQGFQGTSSATWNFTVLDSITQPVLGVGDHSPEFQIAKAPAFDYVNHDNTQFFNDPNYGQFAAYARNLVLYYNQGGFTPPGGPPLVSAAYPTDKITWWGIYNEPSINNFNNNQVSDAVNAANYTTMYNAVVPAMKSADGNIKFVALEMCCGSEDWVPVFASNVTAQVDAVATHYYSSCNQRDTDAQVMGTVPGFVNSVQSIYSSLAPNPTLANVPVWITENNVNADFDPGTGMSACNPGQTFVDDLRGSSAFFAAWRPYVFSQVGKAGVQLLYHWDFAADPQFGELNGSNGQTQLSYWVDYWLGKMFPPGANGRTGRLILQTSNTNTSDVEELAVVNPDQSVVVLISNHAVASTSDNNGAGLDGSVTVNLSGLGPFTTASLVTIDSTTSPVTGPKPVTISPTSPITLTLNGYSSALLKLK